MMELTLTGANIFSNSTNNNITTTTTTATTCSHCATDTNNSTDKKNDHDNSNTTKNNMEEEWKKKDTSSIMSLTNNTNTNTKCTATNSTAALCPTTGEESSVPIIVQPTMENLFFQIKFGTYETFRRVFTAVTTTTSSSSTMNRNTATALLRDDSNPYFYYYYYDTDGHTLAHWATKRSPDLRFMELLISNHFPLHLPSQDTVGMYPIHWAATEGSIPMVSLLLEHIHSNTATTTTTTTTSNIVYNNNITNTNKKNNNKSKLLLETKSPLFDRSTDTNNTDYVTVPNNSKDSNPNTTEEAAAAAAATTTTTTPLSDFFENEDQFTTEPKLSKLGLSSRSNSSTSTTTNAAVALLVVDSTSNKTNNNNYYLSDEDPIHARDLSGCTPLLVASQYGHANLAAFLLKRGADCLVVDKNNDSALHWAAYKGEISIIGLLCHILTSSSFTPTKRNCTTPNNNHFLSLVDSPDTFGQTPIHLAALRGNTDVLEYLLEEVEATSSPINSNNNKKYSYNNSVAVCPLFLRPLARIGNRLGRGRQELYIPLSTVLSEESTTTSCSSTSSRSYGYSPKTLLEMKDNDGRTPLDLAIKYKRSYAELVLNEWHERYNTRSISLFQRICCFLAHDGMKLFCSIESWRAWAGLTQHHHHNTPGGGNDLSSIGQRRMKWPFALVIVSMTLACALYPLRFLPIQSKAAIIMGGSMDAFMHMFTLTNLALGWITFLLTWKTNPGCIKPNTIKKKESQRSSSSATSSGSTRYGTDDMPLEYVLQSLASKLSYQYDDALEQLAHSRPDAVSPSATKSSSIPPLCHTCRIVRPLRSKHCRVQRQCVLLFDHYCPFVGTTIGAYNYRYFYGFLFFISCSEFGFLATWIQYLIRSETFDLLVFLSGCYLAFFIIPSVGLLVYHTDLIIKNLTTNEQQNAWRYSYLQDPATRTYKNQFDEGILGNVYSRLFPSESSYTLLLEQQSLVGSVDDSTEERLC